MMRSLAITLAGLGLWLGCSSSLIAAPGEKSEGSPCKPVIAAFEVVQGSVKPLVTADAEDPAWSGAASGVALHLLGSIDVKVSEAFATRVEMRWEADNLYVRFWCRSPQSPWSPHENRRDAPHHKGDVVEVFLDPVGDARQFIELQVSPANGVFDKLYLLTGEPLAGSNGVLLNDVLKRDQWEFPEWNWDGLRSATSTWKQEGVAVGWIVDLALPAKPLLRRLGLGAFQAPLTLHAHLVRNACPLKASGLNSLPQPSGNGREFWSFSWTPVPIGRPHRAPSLMGELHLVK